jgi:hypothetical protein
MNAFVLSRADALARGERDHFATIAWPLPDS